MGNVNNEEGRGVPPRLPVVPSAPPSLPAPAYFGAIDPNLAASDPRGVMGQIVRNQWADFEKTSVPLIHQLQGMTTYGGNKGIVDGLKTEARNEAKAAFGSILPDAKREAQSYGMSLSKSNIGTLGRAAKLGLAQATVDGDNRATQFQEDLNRQIAAGSTLSNLKQN